MEKAMSEIVIVTPDTAELEAGGHGSVTAAEDFMIIGEATYEVSGNHLRRIKTERKVIADKFADPVRDMWRAYKSLIKMRNDLDQPRMQAEAILKRKRADYRAKEDAESRAREERLRGIARQEAEDAQIAEAVRLEEDGHHEAANEVMASRPMSIVAPTFPTSLPKAKGIALRTTWKARIVSENIIPRQYMIPNHKAIDAHARAMGSSAKISGIEFYPVETEAVKAL